MAVAGVVLTVAVAIRSKAKNSHNGKYSVTLGTDADSKGSKSSGSGCEYTNQLDTSGMWDNRLDDREDALEAFTGMPTHQPSEPTLTHQPVEPICATSLHEKDRKLTTL